MTNNLPFAVGGKGIGCFSIKDQMTDHVFVIDVKWSATLNIFPYPSSS